MESDSSTHDLVFEVSTPLSFRVRVMRSRWELITASKHPVMAGRERDVQEALVNPDQIRCSRRDQNVYLFYKAERAGRWICVVIRRSDDDGFLITTYPTDAVKEGGLLWPR